MNSCDQKIKTLDPKALKSIIEVINYPMVTSCCGVPLLYYLGTFGAEESEFCPSCGECPEVEPVIQNPGQELQFQKLSNTEFEFTFNSKLYYVNIEGPGNNETLSHPLICLDIHTPKLIPVNSTNFDHIYDLEHELHYSQDLGPQLTTYIIDQIKKGGLID